MSTLIDAAKFGVGATAGYRLVDYFAGATQDERLRSKDRQTELAYQRERDRRAEAASTHQQEQMLAAQRYENYEQREFSEKQNREERRNRREIQESINYSNERIAEIESEARRYEADLTREATEMECRTQLEIAAADFNLRERQHQERLGHESDLIDRQIMVQENIARKSRELEKYLTKQKIDSDKAIAKFKTLAARETQILVARENAANVMKDRFVQEALANFPLNISPIVLLRNRSQSLDKLLLFTNTSQNNTSIEAVYEEVTGYSLNPEALSIFITPIYLDSKISYRETLSEQLWDSVYQKVESFFSSYYNRNSTSPVILYPTAWKKDVETGSHACETMYYFLRDMPSFVLEPRFDGRKFSLTISAWGLGYESNEHVRSEIEFDLNITTMLIQSAYTRSKKALQILDNLNTSIAGCFEEKLNKLRHNIAVYEALDIDNCDMSELNAVGVYELFNIDPTQDLAAVTEQITQHINVVLAILTDIHHLRSTDADVVFPGIFKNVFPELFEDREMRRQVFRWYESVYIRFRNNCIHGLTETQQSEMSKIRETQIRNLAFTLELIDESSLSKEIDEAISNYAKERYDFVSDDIEEIWWKCIDEMTLDEIDFFEKIKEQLPRSDKRRRRIINKISNLKN